MNECNAVARTQAQQEAEFRPFADTFEKMDSYVVELDVPGVDPASIEVTAQDQVLSVRGEAVAEVPDGAEPVYRGFGSGTYARSFQLPRDVDAEAIEARVSHGVLRVVLPKRAGAKPRRIEVTTE